MTLLLQFLTDSRERGEEVEGGKKWCRDVEERGRKGKTK